jgi:outer membrane protein OmpA-like peptidoglycan-associated protein
VSPGMSGAVFGQASLSLGHHRARLGKAMRHPILLTGLLLLLPVAAPAQVTIDLRALDGLPPGPSSPRRPPPNAVLRTIPTAPTTHAAPPAAPSAAQGPAPATATASASAPPPVTGRSTSPATAVGPAPTTSATGPAPPAANLPTGAPTVASIAPIPPPATPPNAAPPTPPPVSATAGTTAAPETAGLRLTFKPNESDLTPASSSAIGELVKNTPSGDTVTFNVAAYAAGVADDPSVARRLALARGLSVRAALLVDGVPSTHIYVRALGASEGDGPSDRVDLTVLGASGAAAPSGTASNATATVGPANGGGTTARTAPAAPPKP